MMNNNEHWGWCKACEQMHRAANEDMACPECGEDMTPSARMNKAEQDAAEFATWMRKVMDEGLWGLSPGGAAAELKCSRAHIDMLVTAGVLERTEYDKGGHKVILISQRSVEKAKRNKRATGSWNPRKYGEA